LRTERDFVIVFNDHSIQTYHAGGGELLSSAVSEEKIVDLEVYTVEGASKPTLVVIGEGGIFTVREG
jgi:hypothetical protein